MAHTHTSQPDGRQFFTRVSQTPVFHKKDLGSKITDLPGSPWIQYSAAHK
jgi:hypothetical protein